MNNKEIREAAKRSDVRLWQIAERIGISEFTFCRKLRHELDEAEKAKILAIIEDLKKEKEV
ncbi:MAG: hypothetical protein IKF90_07290 [Parasporobacterium sp.]|nr:hypothetical protein [Parasporobacterium sp.]